MTIFVSMHFTVNVYVGVHRIATFCYFSFMLQMYKVQVHISVCNVINAVLVFCCCDTSSSLHVFNKVEIYAFVS